MDLIDLFKSKNINEWSYQRFAKFFDILELEDDFFKQKINKIYNMIVFEHIMDLELIAKESGCTIEETLLKIKYLKNKRRIGDMYIDSVNKVIKMCDENDKKLLEKYSVFLYRDHFQIKEIALRLPSTSYENLDAVEEQIFKDLEYLNSKGLINGIILNKIDKKIIYYSVEKHKNENDYVTIKCKHCGALNDVNRGNKVRCEYCRSIVEAPSDFQIVHLSDNEKDFNIQNNA